MDYDRSFRGIKRLVVFNGAEYSYEPNPDHAIDPEDPKPAEAWLWTDPYGQQTPCATAEEALHEIILDAISTSVSDEVEQDSGPDAGSPKVTLRAAARDVNVEPIVESPAFPTTENQPEPPSPPESKERVNPLSKAALQAKPK